MARWIEAVAMVGFGLYGLWLAYWTAFLFTMRARYGWHQNPNPDGPAEILNVPMGTAYGRLPLIGRPFEQSFEYTSRIFWSHVGGGLACLAAASWLGMAVWRG